MSPTGSSERPPTTRAGGDNVIAFPDRPRPDTTQRPAHPIGSPRGRWTYSTGDDGDGYPRGVYAFFRAGSSSTVLVDVHRKLGPLPYVLRVLEYPNNQARFRVLYHLSMLEHPDLDDRDQFAIVTRGQIMSGEWEQRLCFGPVPAVLSGDPPIIRAVGRAILDLAAAVPTERGH